MLHFYSLSFAPVQAALAHSVYIVLHSVSTAFIEVTMLHQTCLHDGICDSIRCLLYAVTMYMYKLLLQCTIIDGKLRS
jgi:hypothetical protein